MKKIILYGAGKRGIKYARLLCNYDIEIAGFCDTYKTGSVVYECMGGGKKEKPIFDLEQVDCSKYSMIIAIADKDQYEEVKRKVNGYEIDVFSIEEAIEETFSQEKDIVKANREYVAGWHVNDMDGYFELAERSDSLNIFWGKESLFNQMFQELDLTKVVELACGRGRHVQKYISDAKNIILVDILKKNIDYCKQRFSKVEKIQYYVNNGYDLSQIKSESCTSLFTYDAMVHFEMLDIFQYLKETKRILVKGGKALFHHSNNTENYKVTFSTGKHGRNYMSDQLFAYLANRAGLIVIEQHVVDWGEDENLDCITLVEKR